MMASSVSEYQLRAALRAARLIDLGGNEAYSAIHAYRNAATDGEHDTVALASAESLLLRARLLRKVAGRIHPTPVLATLCALEDDDALMALASALSAVTASERSQGDDAQETLGHLSAGEDTRETLGAAGEDFVLEYCRTQLAELGRDDLAGRVQRVSLISDRLGYDIVAPRLAGRARHLEVKTQARRAVHTFRFFISRNEYEVGRTDRLWALVCCSLHHTPDLLGWCRADALFPYLPQDRNGRWTEALVVLPVSVLRPGIPEPI